MRACLARLQRDGDKKTIVAKDAFAYVLFDISRKTIGVINMSKILMNFKKCKTLNEETARLAVMLSNPDFNAAELSADDLASIYQMLGTKVPSIETNHEEEETADADDNDEKAETEEEEN